MTRPLNRLIQDEVKRPLGDELLFGDLAKGGHVEVDVEDGQVTFQFSGSSRLTHAERTDVEPADGKELLPNR